MYNTNDNKDRINKALKNMDPGNYDLQGSHLTLTKEGWLVSDDICARLFI